MPYLKKIPTEQYCFNDIFRFILRLLLINCQMSSADVGIKIILSPSPYFIGRQPNQAHSVVDIHVGVFIFNRILLVVVNGSIRKSFCRLSSVHFYFIWFDLINLNALLSSSMYIFRSHLADSIVTYQWNMYNFRRPLHLSDRITILRCNS